MIYSSPAAVIVIQALICSTNPKIKTTSPFKFQHSSLPNEAITPIYVKLDNNSSTDFPPPWVGTNKVSDNYTYKIYI